MAALTVLTLAAFAAPGRAGQVLYTAELNIAGSHLARLSPNTGAVVETFPDIPGIHIDGMAYDPSTDTLYGFDGGDGLYAIDRTSGDYDLVGLTSSVNITGLAIEPTTFDLYGISSIGGSLWLIDKTTGTPTLIGPTVGRMGFGHGLDFSAEGTLYATDTIGAATTGLHTIDLATGESTFVVNIDRDVVVGLAFDENGVLYGTDNAANTLIRIDPISGLATTVGPVGGGWSHNALAFVPEPATVLLFLAGALPILSRRRG